MEIQDRTASIRRRITLRRNLTCPPRTVNDQHAPETPTLFATKSTIIPRKFLNNLML